MHLGSGEALNFFENRINRPPALSRRLLRPGEILTSGYCHCSLSFRPLVRRPVKPFFHDGSLTPC